STVEPSVRMYSLQPNGTTRHVRNATARDRPWHVACCQAGVAQKQRSPSMLWTIFVILLILWLLGMVSGATLGGFIHLLLILAIVVVLIRVIQGRNPI